MNPLSEPEVHAPKVSVIIPNYNQTQFVGNAIQSVLCQTFKDYEIIVIDDGSTDNSKDVVNAFGDKVRYIRQENKGLGGARNTGILASNAEFVGLLDADDEWMPTYLEKVIALTHCFKDAVVFYSSARGMDSRGNDLPQIFGRMVQSSIDIYQGLLRANFIIPSTVIMRRAVIVEMGLFEQNNREIHGCEDWDLWLRLSPLYQIVGTSECLVRYRLHENTFSADSHHMQRAVRAVIEKNFGVEDGKYESWPVQRRRAFGGVYRYHALTSIQKQRDWKAGSKYLSKAFEVDPTLAFDLDLFYELAFNTQPLGHRETILQSGLVQAGTAIMKMLANIFEVADSKRISVARSKAYGTANYAIGLAAYNAGHRALSRQYLLKALFFCPELWHDRLLVGNIIKSFLGKPLTNLIKKLVSSIVSISRLS
jgi:glycosyltransferase involved in cell wall biosynthesis